MINVRNVSTADGHLPPIADHSFGQIAIQLPETSRQPRQINSTRQQKQKPGHSHSDDDVLPSYEMATRSKLFQIS